MLWQTRSFRVQDPSRTSQEATARTCLGVQGCYEVHPNALLEPCEVVAFKHCWGVPQPQVPEASHTPNPATTPPHGAHLRPKVLAIFIAIPLLVYVRLCVVQPGSLNPSLSSIICNKVFQCRLEASAGTRQTSMLPQHAGTPSMEFLLRSNLLVGSFCCLHSGRLQYKSSQEARGGALARENWQIQKARSRHSTPVRPYAPLLCFGSPPRPSLPSIWGPPPTLLTLAQGGVWL